jgi:cyclophilin family peptidyl-prolyl cis-trans isomerase
MYTVLTVLLVALVFSSCEQQSPYSKFLTEEYPKLYEHVLTRNADSLYAYTRHDDKNIREQAWRALISTPYGDVDDFISKVQYDNSQAAWMALSTKDITNAHLERLMEAWDRRDIQRDGINMVFGLKGNEATMDFLMDNFRDLIDKPYEYSAALALSRLMMRHDMSESTKQILFKYAAVINDAELFRAYFYGLYRSNQGVDSEEMQNTLWDTYTWDNPPAVKQYVARILFNTDAEWFFEQLSIDDISSANVQLAVELAQQSNKVEWSDKVADFYSNLLNHPNPVVNEVTLNQIQARSDKPSGFDETIVTNVIEADAKEASIRLSGIASLSDASDYLDLANELAGQDEYLLIKKLSIYSNEVGTQEYLDILEDHIAAENRMEALFAANALSAWWESLSQSQKTAAVSDRVKGFLFNLLDHNDRSITYVTVNFMGSSGLIGQNDFSRIESVIAQYQLPEDVEVYQAFGGLLYDHFEQQAAPLIEEWVQEGNYALNNTLRQQGWDVPEQEQQPQEFRVPNWQQLATLGADPVWVLATEKDTIKITMNVLLAPVTISGMDSLTRADAYNDIAFHRVVPNFVIQGGDVETGDGFGGPDYVVPTEASELEYRRAMVGIASAGTDTEGSQYFVMHQWAPHLNGSYTIIGEVTEGMDVVDRIIVGDKVVDAFWQTVER